MDAPTLTAVRAESPLLNKTYPEDNDGDHDQLLESRILTAGALVASMTWRLIEPVTESTQSDATFEEVPDSLVPVATRAIALYVERSAMQGDVKFAKKIATGQLLRSFQAGPYGETYFAPGELKKGGAGRPMMDWSDELDALLWALATVGAREYFVQQANGEVAPASYNANLNWDSALRGY